MEDFPIPFCFPPRSSCRSIVYRHRSQGQNIFILAVRSLADGFFIYSPMPIYREGYNTRHRAARRQKSAKGHGLAAGASYNPTTAPSGCFPVSIYPWAPDSLPVRQRG